MAELRKALVAAEMWCDLLNIDAVAISIAPVYNHPGERYKNNHVLRNSKFGSSRMGHHSSWVGRRSLRSLPESR
jgi:hypothetical protein